MKTVTITELRRNIFQLIDETLATGEPLVVSRGDKRLILRTERPSDAPTAEERAERWRKFWAEPPPEGWEEVDLSPDDIRRAREQYWRWDGEPELDR